MFVDKSIVIQIMFKLMDLSTTCIYLSSSLRQWHSAHKREVVSGVTAMPQGTEKERGKPLLCGRSVVTHESQPDGRLNVPVVNVRLETSGSLQ